MLIQYRTTGHKREVDDAIGRRLCGGRIAFEVKALAAAPTEIADGDDIDTRAAQTYLTRDMQAETPLTGRQKRAYRRRDVQAGE